MAFNLRDFLKDKGKYPDTHKVTLADGVDVTIGDLRAFQDNEDQQISTRVNELNQREQILGQAADEVANLRAAVEDMRRNPAQAAQDPQAKQLIELLQNGLRGGQKVSVFEEPGDYFKPLVERLSEIGKQIETAQKHTNDTRQDIEKTFAWHLRRQVQKEFNAYKDWPEKFGMREAIDYAKQNRLLDEMQYPDWDAVHDRVTAPARQKADADKLREEIRTEERENARKDATAQRQRDVFVPTPGGSGGGAPSGKKFGGIEKVSEADILNDETIWNLNGAGGN